MPDRRCVLALVLASIACALAGLCYAEFASIVPVAGSAYTYAYATLGELTAWIIGWCLLLEYLFAGCDGGHRLGGLRTRRWLRISG
jgi:amino acid transporter